MMRRLLLVSIFILVLFASGLPVQGESPVAVVTLKGPDVAYNWLRLPFTGRVMVGDQPVPEVGVELRADGGYAGWAKTDQAGRFAIPKFFAHAPGNRTFTAVVDPSRETPGLGAVESEPVVVEVRRLEPPTDPGSSFEMGFHSFSAFRYEGTVQVYAHLVGWVDPAEGRPRDVEGRVELDDHGSATWPGTSWGFDGVDPRRALYSAPVFLNGVSAVSVGPFHWGYDRHTDPCHDRLNTHLVSWIRNGDGIESGVAAGSPEVCLEWPE